MTEYRRAIDTQCCNAWMHGIRTINGQYPDDNREFGIIEGGGIEITPVTAGIKIKALIPANALKYQGTVGTGGTIPSLPAADPDNQGDVYIALSAATSPVIYNTGDTLISNGSTWQVIPSGDDIVPIVTSWQATPDDAHVPSEKLVKDSIFQLHSYKVDGIFITTPDVEQQVTLTLNTGKVFDEKYDYFFFAYGTKPASIRLSSALVTANGTTFNVYIQAHEDFYLSWAIYRVANPDGPVSPYINSFTANTNVPQNIGGNWTLRTPDNDWSDLFDTSNNTLVAKCDMVISYGLYIAPTYVPKGYTTPANLSLTYNTSNTSGNTLYANGIVKIYKNRIPSNYTNFEANLYKKTFTTDGISISISSQTETSYINKSDLLIYVKS